MKKPLITLLVLTISVLLSAPALACPAIDQLPDFNCDGKIRIVVLGDSLVSGVGDTKNNNTGGYVLRTQNRFLNAQVDNFGVAGLNTVQLLLKIQRAFDGRGNVSLAAALVQADLVILDLGRNDRWFFGEPLQTSRRLKKSVDLIQRRVTTLAEYPPLIVTAVLMLPNRGSQGPWVKDLNQLILKSHSKEKPADLRFDLVSKRLLSDDQIHPTPAGYNALSIVLRDYLLKSFPKHATAMRIDQDDDLLYDIFERSKFGTDPQLRDTDGDGLIDGNDPTPAG